MSIVCACMRIACGRAELVALGSQLPAQWDYQQKLDSIAISPLCAPFGCLPRIAVVKTMARSFREATRSKCATRVELLTTYWSGTPTFSAAAGRQDVRRASLERSARKSKQRRRALLSNVDAPTCTIVGPPAHSSDSCTHRRRSIHQLRNLVRVQPMDAAVELNSRSPGVEATSHAATRMVMRRPVNGMLLRHEAACR